MVTTNNTGRYNGSRLNLPAPDKSYKPITTMIAPARLKKNVIIMKLHGSVASHETQLIDSFLIPLQ